MTSSIAVMDHTDGHGADVVFDLVGGDANRDVWTCVAREGRYLPVGFNGDDRGRSHWQAVAQGVDRQLLRARRDAVLQQRGRADAKDRHEPVPTRDGPRDARRAVRARRQRGDPPRDRPAHHAWTRSPRRSRTTSSAALSGRTVVDIAAS